jgi:two-component system chemotaxis response regulator CheY
LRGFFLSKFCLIVDDSRVVRKVAVRIIEDLGFSCLEAENGVVALEKCNHDMPDLILLDWNMPSMSGLEFLEHLRLMEQGAKPFVILCTTENEVGQIDRALKAGANEYIIKPFDRDLIIEKLKSLSLL